MKKTIDGRCYAEMLKSGAANLAQKADVINAMNVFPVADGDTGTNMQRTIVGGISEIGDNIDGIGAVSSSFAHGALLGARGNSGVILSQMFAGINEHLKDCQYADAHLLAEAYKSGIKRSYASVQNPTEGTILTVFRESTEYASLNINENSGVDDFFRLHIDEARRSLERTKEIMPLLAEEDVVDSGGAGYLAIAEGMYDALMGNPHAFTENGSKEKVEKVNINLFTRDSVLEFGYCTEFLLRLMTAKVDPDSFDIENVISVLRELSGESIVAYKEGDVVKVHVHTHNPGEILSRMQAFGEFLTVKIENMSLGHSDEALREKAKPKKKKKPFSVVAVASGEGLSALFADMGADKIVTGGQTINPSVEEFVCAFEECDSSDIIVLPNNKNVVLAANGAAEIYDGARVHIVETHNIAEGYAALSVITPGITDIDALVSSAKNAARGVVSAEITKAVRDATIEGVAVNAGDYMALSGGKIAATAENAEDALCRLMATLDTDDFEILTLFVGRDVSDDNRADVTEKLTEEYPDLEITVHIGGQGVYDYLVSLE